MKSEKEIKDKINEIKHEEYDVDSVYEIELRAQLRILEWVLESEVEQ